MQMPFQVIGPDRRERNSRALLMKMQDQRVRSYFEVSQLKTFVVSRYIHTGSRLPIRTRCSPDIGNNFPVLVSEARAYPRRAENAPPLPTVRNASNFLLIGRSTAHIPIHARR